MDEDWDEEIASGVVYKPQPPPVSTTQASFGMSSSYAMPPPPQPPHSSNRPFGRGRPFGGGSGGGEREDRSGSSYRDRNNNTNSEFSSRFDDANNNSNGGDDTVTIESYQVSSLIGRGGATVSNIREQCQVRINIPSRDEIGTQRFVQVKVIGSEENVKRAKEMIRETLDDVSRSRSRDTTRDSNMGNKRNFGTWNDSNSSSSYDNHQAKKSHYGEETSTSTSEEPSLVINWDLIRSQPLQNLSKFKDHPPVLKDFYVEAPEITSMTRDEVDKFRKENYDISVSFFVKETLSYCSSVVKNEEEEALKTKTPEELADLVHEQIPKPVKSIEQAFGLYPEILAECKRQNFNKPTPIQAQIWPILLKGLDCIGIAQTGTGKTLGFLLPALVHTDKQTTPRGQRVGPNVLVLSPTRELAIQIEQEVKKINYKGMKSVVVYGGGDRKEQVNVCDQGVEIVIATPGRLYDLIQAGVINVTSVTFLVLDEADRMLDMGFEPQIMKILLDIRPDRQTVMTSATWPEGVRRLAIKYLTKPVQLYVGSLDLRAAKTVKQHCVLVRSDDDKKDQLLRYIEREMTDEDKLLVFVGRKATADNLSCDLIMKGIQCQSIHGDREQCDREEALADFKESRVRILIATDVASRGIDVKDITRVINFDFPRNIEEYVHRVGRTGRAGRTGEAFTYVAREDWKHAKELIQILEQGEQEIPSGLVEMSERYEAMQKKKLEEGSMMGGGFSSRGSRGGGGGGGGGDGCFNCGEHGHFSRECPKKGGSGSGGGFSRGGRSGGGFTGRGRRGPQHNDRYEYMAL